MGNNETKEIAKSAFLVTIMMLGFKFIGFIKQAVIAYVFGATNDTDAYFIAWGFVSGISEAIVKAILVSLVAIYTNLRVKNGKRQADKLINGLIIVLIPIFIIFIIIIIALSPVLSTLLAPTYQNDQKHTLTLFIILLSPILVFGCLELIFGAVLDSYKSFFIPRLQSFIYSISVIIFCFILSNSLGIKALIIAQYFSSFVFSIMLIVSVRKYHSFFFVKYKEIPELKNILLTAIPLFIGNSVLQINQIVDKSITSSIGEGTASALSYCHTLEQFVTNIMIVNIGNVMFANFAELVAKSEYDSINKVLSKAINSLIVIITAISIITIVCATDIVSIVYYRGSFSFNAVRLTSTALVGYSISFVAVAVRDLSIKSLYAFKDTKLPMFSSIITIIVNIFLSIVLSRFIGIMGVSLATSISAFLGMIICAYFLKKHLHTYHYFNHIFVFFRCLPGSIALLLICIIIKHSMITSSLYRFLLSSFVGFPVYIFFAYIFKVDIVKELYTITKQKLSRRLTKS